MARDPLPPGLGLALEEALLRGYPAPRVLVWRHRPVVVAGRSSREGLDYSCEWARALGVPVVRRRSGGGAVFHDEGNINIAIILPGRRSPGELYSLLHRALGLALTLLGVEHWAENGSDLIARGGFKVSGAAALLAREGSLAHATLLVESMDPLIPLLTPPRLDLVQRGAVTPAKYRPRSLRSLNPSAGLGRTLGALVEALMHLGAQPPSRTPSGALARAAALLGERRYAGDECGRSESS